MIYRHPAAAGLGLAVLLAAGAPRAETLAVTVEGVASDVGSVLVAVCTEATFLTADCPFSASVPARAGRVDIVIEDIPPGTYAIQAFHDENDNLDLDRSFIGFPKEGLGFSNDAPMKYGPPRYADAAVDIGEQASTSVTMRYY